MANLYLAARRALLLLACLSAMAIGNVALAQGADHAKVFDHATTGFDLFGAHAFVTCESCHVGGQFAGTPRQCVGCHQPNGRFNARSKPVDHILSSNQCDTCHNPTLWQDIIHVDHTQVFGQCMNCHNGFKATGKPAHHIPTHDRCAECHSDMAFTPAFFSHEGIDGGCVACHNGVSVSGRSAGHIPINAQACEACHQNSASTLMWAPVVIVDHDYVIGACSSCHSPGGKADTHKPPTHLPTTENCSACHSVPPAKFGQVDQVDHSEFLAPDNCRGCHNGVIAPGQEQNPNHIDDGGQDCDTCHTSTTIWSMTIFGSFSPPKPFILAEF